MAASSAFKWLRGQGSLLGGLYSNSLSLLKTSSTTTCHDVSLQQRRTFIQMGTILKVVDNSGAKEIKCIRAFAGKKGARLGDMIMASVKDACSIKVKKAGKHDSSAGKVKKGDVVRAVVVRAAMPISRCDGSVIKFDDNAAVIIEKGPKKKPEEVKKKKKKKKMSAPNPVGTRVFGPIPHELRRNKHLKILSLAEQNA